MAGNKEATTLSAKVSASSSGDNAKGEMNITSRTSRVTFPKEPVSNIQEVEDYDRSAVPSDIFSCDVCGQRIPCGIRGFEPYGTCEHEHCPDGFDACGMCIGADKLLSKCRPFSLKASIQLATIKSKCHKHKLTVVDRGAEVVWANDNDNTTSAAIDDDNTLDAKRPGMAPSKSPRKKTKV